MLAAFVGPLRILKAKIGLTTCPEEPDAVLQPSAPLAGARRKKSLSCRVGSIYYIGHGGRALGRVRNIFDLGNLASQPVGEPVRLNEHSATNGSRGGATRRHPGGRRVVNMMLAPGLQRTGSVTMFV